LPVELGRFRALPCDLPDDAMRSVRVGDLAATFVSLTPDMSDSSLAANVRTDKAFVPSFLLACHSSQRVVRRERGGICDAAPLTQIQSARSPPAPFP
jgi:hypothetical protein